jgi:hypothetical protein
MGPRNLIFLFLAAEMTNPYIEKENRIVPRINARNI